MFMLYRYITNSNSGAMIPAHSEKSTCDVNLAISADSAPVNLFQTGQALDLWYHYVMGLCLGQFYVLYIPTRLLSTFPWHPLPFYCTLGTLPSCPPRLYYALTVFSVR